MKLRPYLFGNCWEFKHVERFIKNWSTLANIDYHACFPFAEEEALEQPRELALSERNMHWVVPKLKQKINTSETKSVSFHGYNLRGKWRNKINFLYLCKSTQDLSNDQASCLKHRKKSGKSDSNVYQITLTAKALHLKLISVLHQKLNWNEHNEMLWAEADQNWQSEKRWMISITYTQ